MDGRERKKMRHIEIVIVLTHKFHFSLMLTQTEFITLLRSRTPKEAGRGSGLSSAWVFAPCSHPEAVWADFFSRTASLPPPSITVTPLSLLLKGALE